MKRERSLRGRIVAALLSAAPLWPVACPAQSSDIDPDAIALLRRSTDYLGSLKQFRLETAVSIEAVTSAGQKLQFDARVRTSVMRPSSSRAARVGEQVSKVLFYDVKSLTMSMVGERYYATVAAPPTLDAMVDFAADKLDVIAPGTDLIYSNAFERLTEGLNSAFFVGEAMIGGVRCVHLALRNPEVDWQIWIQDGDKPLPRKFVVTSKRMPQSPQFEVTVSSWDVAPKLNDTVFRFAPSSGWRKIDFLPVTAVAKK